MATDGPADPFLQPLWPRIRGRLYHLSFVLRRPMTLGVRAVIHDRAARSVFLIRHTYVPGWQLPGGGVERGETVEEALAREVEEECHIRLTGRAVLRSIHFSRHVSPRDHVAVFLAEQFERIAPRLPDREIAEAGFFPLDALPDHVTPGTRRRLTEIFEGAEISPDW